MAIEKTVCYSSYPRGGGTPCHGVGGHTGSTRVSQEAEGMRGIAGKSPYCGFPGKSGQGRASRCKTG